MLNIFVSDKMPNLKYEKVTRQFLNNTIAFTYGCHTGDTSSFDPVVLTEIEKDSNWLEAAAGEMQRIIIQSLVGDDNFESEDQLETELLALINLCCIMGEQELTQWEDALMLQLHDKFTLSLLSSDRFLSTMYQMGVRMDGD